MAILLIFLWLLTCQAEFNDEIQTYEQSCIGEDIFQCSDGICIPQIEYCDGVTDCTDNSDESFCPDMKNPQFCSGSLNFLCADNKKCIVNSLVCNNITDCDDGSDEKNCSFTSTENNNARCHGFPCDGKRCISLVWICDGQYDCVDKTDELLDVCRHKIHGNVNLFDMVNCDTVEEFPDGPQKSYRCLDSSYCLPSPMMCDGLADCRDRSDEGKFCDNWHTVCSSNPCKGNNTKCLPERYGYFCVCDDPNSQQYNYTTNQCQPINECESVRPYCSHFCESNKTGFNCFCEKGYTLDESGHRCHAGDPEAMLFYSTLHEIGYITLKTKNHVTVATGIKQAHGVTSDGKFLFWVETAQGHQAIMRADMENVAETKQVLVSLGLEEPGDIALDWLGGHIYFSDATRGIIAVCRTDGSICATLPVVAFSPKFVTLAVKYGKMFWADWHHKPMIKTALMNGTGSEVLTDDLTTFATGLTVDVPNKRLYYVDHSRVKVIRIDNKQTYSLFSEPFYHPYAIAVFENFVYWSDMMSHAIQISDKMHRSGEVTRKFITMNSSVFDMHIYHPLLIGQFGHDSSPCLNMSCSHLCLLTSDVTGACACPDGMELNGTTCYHLENHRPQYLIIGAGTEFTRIQYNSLGNPETHATHFDIGWVQAMAYDNVRDTLHIYDGKYKRIQSINMSDFTLGVTKSLSNTLFIDVIDMDYDYATDSLYLLAANYGLIAVVSLRTHESTLFYPFLGDEVISFCIIPEYGKMLVAIRDDENGDIHIDSMGLDGSERKRVIDNELRGPTIRLRYAHDMDIVYFSDEGNGKIDIINPEGKGRDNFKTLTTSVTSLEVTEYLFWTDRRTQRLFWASVHDITHRVRRIEFSIFPNDTHLHIQATRPPPDPNNPLMKHPCLLPNTCSDICIQKPHPHPTSNKNVTFGYKCLCRPTLHLADGKCIEKPKCRPDELYCRKSNNCALKAKRCDGKKDCTFGEDEEGCTENVKTPKVCALNEISCNGGCIDKRLNCNSTKYDNQTAQCESTQWPCKTGSLCVERSQVCDGQTDCPDGTDEGSAVCDTMTCMDHEFTCTMGSCIMSSFRCDGEVDCSDGSDEENCDNKTCTVGHYQCRNKQCIELHKRCDGQSDCVDFSDEEQCEESVTNEEVTHCAAEEYACALNTSICLPATARFDSVDWWRCNWKIDCPGGTDEIDCDRCAPRGQFKCMKELKCVPRKKVCDGTKNCNDGSDETPQACQFVNRTSFHRTHTPFLIGECNHGYVCDTGDCLEWRQVCDNILDCYDGSDENGQCSSACQNTTCSHKCQPTPRGRRCKCPHGLQLQTDQRTCVDIDECADDVCSQVCHNLPGTFLCSCHRGYTLRADRRSCKAIQGTMSILYASGNTVHSLSADGNSVLEYIDQNITSIGGIDANIRENKLYVTAPDAGKLIQVNGPNTPNNVTVITNIGTPTKVAVDWLTGNVYFVDRGANGKNCNIRVCNVDKKKCATLPQTSLAEGTEITALVIDPASRRMFYCATHEGESVVWSFSLSGRIRTDLATVGNCTGLAVDSYKRMLYVAETGPAQITRMDFFGDKQFNVKLPSRTAVYRKTWCEVTEIDQAPSNYVCQLTTVIPRISNCRFNRLCKTVVADHPRLEAPQGLVIFEDWVYFLAANSIKLSRCRLYGLKTCQALDYRMFDANTFVIRHPSVQRNDLNNFCADYVCSNICVLDNIGPQCLCYDGTVAKNGVCAEPRQNLEPVIDGRIPGGYSRVTEVTVAVISAILFLLALYLGIYVYYRCVGRRNSESNYVEVRFQNNPSTSHIGPVLEMPTNAISSGVACGASAASAYEFVNPLQYVRNLMYSSYRRTTRPIGTAGLEITVPSVEVSSDTESDLDDKDTRQIIK